MHMWVITRIAPTSHLTVLNYESHESTNDTNQTDKA
jgi:hypothetical protein